MKKNLHIPKFMECLYKIQEEKKSIKLDDIFQKDKNEKNFEHDIEYGNIKSFSSQQVNHILTSELSKILSSNYRFFINKIERENCDYKIDIDLEDIKSNKEIKGLKLCFSEYLNGKILKPISIEYDNSLYIPTRINFDFLMKNYGQTKQSQYIFTKKNIQDIIGIDKTQEVIDILLKYGKITELQKNVYVSDENILNYLEKYKKTIDITKTSNLNKNYITVRHISKQLKKEDEINIKATQNNKKLYTNDIIKEELKKINLNIDHNKVIDILIKQGILTPLGLGKYAADKDIIQELKNNSGYIQFKEQEKKEIIEQITDKKLQKEYYTEHQLTPKQTNLNILKDIVLYRLSKISDIKTVLGIKHDKNDTLDILTVNAKTKKDLDVDLFFLFKNTNLIKTYAIYNEKKYNIEQLPYLDLDKPREKIIITEDLTPVISRGIYKDNDKYIAPKILKSNYSEFLTKKANNLINELYIDKKINSKLQEHYTNKLKTAKTIKELNLIYKELEEIKKI